MDSQFGIAHVWAQGDFVTKAGGFQAHIPVIQFGVLAALLDDLDIGETHAHTVDAHQ